MQRGALDRHPADTDRKQLGDRGEGPGPSDLGDDGHNSGRGLPGGEFIRHRPARRARDRSQAVLQPEIVNPYDHAVNFKRQRVTLRLQRVTGRKHLGQILTHLSVGHGFQPPGLERLDKLLVRGQPPALNVAQAVTQEIQRTFGCHGRVKLLEGPGGRVARVGKGRLTGFEPFGVEATKCGV